MICNDSGWADEARELAVNTQFRQGIRSARCPENCETLHRNERHQDQYAKSPHNSREMKGASHTRRWLGELLFLQPNHHSLGCNLVGELSQKKFSQRPG